MTCTSSTSGATMLHSFSLVFPVSPVACPRPRVTRFGVYYPKTYKVYKTKIVSHIRSLGVYGSALPYKALEVKYVFVLPRPKRLMRRKDYDGRILHTKKPDLDNLIKAINDSMQEAGLFADDSLICLSSSAKYYASKAEPAHIEVTIKEGGTVQPPSQHKTT